MRRKLDGFNIETNGLLNKWFDRRDVSTAMKTKRQISLKPLRDEVDKQLSPRCGDPKYSLFKEQVMPLLADESADFAKVQELLEEIVRVADRFDDGSVFSLSQDLANRLEALARAALSEGVPVFPGVEVKLSLAKATSSKQGGSRKPEPGSRTRLGGKPQWLQVDATPICAECQKTMTFVAQIDSIANEDSKLGRLLADTDSFMFADVGMIYVFWCSGCMGTQAILQCG